MSIIIPGESIPEGPLVDRVLMLNTAKAPRFQCYNFVVTRNAPIQIVPKVTSEPQLRKALADGILLDVTGQQEAEGGAFGKIFSDIDKAVASKNMSGVQEGEEIGPRVIIGTDAKGNSYVITPKDEADYQRMQAEIAATGSLRIEKPKPKNLPTAQFTGLSSIYTEDLPAPPPEE